MSNGIYIKRSIMDSKKCVICKIIKDKSDYHKNKTKKDGLQDVCKECRKKRATEKKDNLQKYKKNWYIKNQDYLKKKSNDRYHDKKDDINRDKRNRYKTDKEYKEKITEQKKRYYQNNKNKIRLLNKRWSQLNRDIINKISRKHYHNNKQMMICRRILKRTLSYLGGVKENETIIELGYTPLELKINIESKFKDGMSWENYGEWHIDHIKPICSFDKHTHPSIVNSLGNLQPLWAFENLSKGGRILES